MLTFGGMLASLGISQAYKLKFIIDSKIALIIKGRLSTFENCLGLAFVRSFGVIMRNEKMKKKIIF